MADPLDAINAAYERVNGRGAHAPAPPLVDEIRFDGDGNLLTRDADGTERYVMVDFERPLMEKTAEVLCRRGGHVLNVGFGCGLVDEAIQRQTVASHTIIEAHPVVHAKMLAEGWDRRPGVTILHERWENVDWWNYAGRFDGIFWDIFPYEPADPLLVVFLRECVLKALRPDTGVFVLYGPGLTKELVEREVRAFRKPVVIASIDRCTVDVPFLIPEWERLGLGSHEIDVYALRVPS